MSDNEHLDYLIIFVLALLIVVCVTCNGCYAPASDPRIDEYATQCNAGYAASCIAMQAVYQNAQTQAAINDNDALASRARMQNFWLAQQQSGDATFNNATNQINFTRSQLVK
jgi:hypothetical protein